MSTALEPVDLSAATVGTSGSLSWTADDVQAGGATGLGAGQAHIRLTNESGCGLLIHFANGSSDVCAAGQWHVYRIPAGSLSLRWSVLYVLPGGNVSQLLATVYGPGELVPTSPTLGNSPVGVGGTVATSTVNQVINDGNAAPTEVLEATPQGASASQAKINNDGSAILGGGHITIDNAGNVAGASIAASEIGTGYPAADLGAGTLPAGVAVPAANVGTGYPAADLGAGTVPAGVTVPGANVTGTVPAATHASSLDDATITQGHPLKRADQALAQVGFGLTGGNAAGVAAYDQNAEIGGQATTIKVNNYFTGTQDTFVTANPAYQYQLVGGTGLRWRQNTNTPTAGAAITWGAWQTLIDTTGAYQGAGVATTQAVDTTHANSNTPQVKASAAAGLSVGDATINTRQYVQLMPTESDATARGIALGYVDTAGAYHALVGCDAGAGLRLLSTGDIYRVASFFSGTAAGTYSHNLGATPSFVGVTTTELNSTETVGVDTIGSTSCHVNEPNSWPFVAMASA